MNSSNLKTRTIDYDNHIFGAWAPQSPAFFAFFRGVGEEQEKATKEAKQLLKIIEDHGLGQKKFSGGNKIGLADLAFGWLSAWLEVMEEVVRWCKTDGS